MTATNFETKAYNGVSIIINKADGYVNASQMCTSNGKAWRNYKNTKSWISIKNAFERRFCKGARINAPSYFLEKVNPKYQGEYIHPKLVHFVAEYCSIDYAFTVAEIMDGINDKVHDALKKQELEDTAENSKPVFMEIAKQIAPSIQTNAIDQQCWGIRDSPYKLDCWERDELRTVIENYQRIKEDYEKVKERLDEQEKKIDEFGIFVKQYHPEFQK